MLVCNTGSCRTWLLVLLAVLLFGHADAFWRRRRRRRARAPPPPTASCPSCCSHGCGTDTRCQTSHSFNLGRNGISYTYTTNVCKACISGDMEVLMADGTHARVDALHPGDRVTGATAGAFYGTSEQTCKVLSVDKTAESALIYDNMTAGHFYIEEGPGDMFTGPKVFEQSAVNPELSREGPVFNVATDCLGFYNRERQLVTPLSKLFCPNGLSWDEYTSMFTRILVVVQRTGVNWFNPNLYHNNVSSFSNHTMLAADAWTAKLPNICGTMLDCADGSSDCASFESSIVAFVETHLPEPEKAKVRAAYPALGDPATGMSSDVRPWPWTMAALAAVGVAVAGAIAVATVYRRRRDPHSKILDSDTQRSESDVQRSPPAVAQA